MKRGLRERERERSLKLVEERMGILGNASRIKFF
jgi:hypothetical protein